jgi:hypothetical protein
MPDRAAVGQTSWLQLLSEFERGISLRPSDARCRVFCWQSIWDDANAATHRDHCCQRDFGRVAWHG